MWSFNLTMNVQYIIIYNYSNKLSNQNHIIFGVPGCIALFLVYTIYRYYRFVNSDNELLPPHIFYRAI